MFWKSKEKMISVEDHLKNASGIGLVRVNLLININGNIQISNEIAI